jgi:hypothetical protein
MSLINLALPDLASTKKYYIFHLYLIELFITKMFLFKYFLNETEKLKS